MLIELSTLLHVCDHYDNKGLCLPCLCYFVYQNGWHYLLLVYFNCFIHVCNHVWPYFMCICTNMLYMRTIMLSKRDNSYYFVTMIRQQTNFIGFTFFLNACNVLSAASKSSSTPSHTTGIIVGVTVGSVVVIGFVAGILAVTLRRRRRRQCNK